ncbi:WhiB family transcriptional regulator [Egicoccus halophilus]|uniref:Transcriptional regulator WhiB n=1 Tax=Egicoccus halophilus TaxID=1670830 RepID=A0A8J3EQN1_9ACTN|nr:WhiB family transcriptional regulator [Egicoccus halophilus]GGI02733.1 hypothetical protein GCM10011354_01360 [Egicoccus halophilus]
MRLVGPTILFATEGWEQQAGCRTEDPTLFFGPPGFESKHDRLRREAEAKAVCAACPAIVACREQALLTGESYGVWGGLGEADRRAVMARRDPRLAARAG